MKKKEDNTQKTPTSDVPPGPFAISVIYAERPTPVDFLLFKFQGLPFCFVPETPTTLVGYAVSKQAATGASRLKETLYAIPEENNATFEELFDETARKRFKDGVFVWKKNQHLTVKDALSLVFLASTTQTNAFPLTPRKVERWWEEEIDEQKAAPELPSPIFPWIEAKTPDGNDMFTLLADCRFGGGESKDEQFLRSCLHSIWSIAYPGPDDVEREFTDLERGKDLSEALWKIEPLLDITIDLPVAIAYLRETERKERESMGEVESMLQKIEELRGKKRTNSELIASILPKAVFADSEKDYAIVPLELTPGKVTLKGKAAVRLLWDHLILLHKIDDFTGKDVEALQDMLDEAKHRRRTFQVNVRKR